MGRTPATIGFWTLSLLIGCQQQGSQRLGPQAEGLNGRWNIDVKTDGRHSPFWMEVKGAGTDFVEGRLIGVTGGRASAFIDPEIRDGELRFEVSRRYEDNSEVRAETIARLVGDRLVGATWIGKRKVEWEGRRPPRIEDRDDGGWCDGATTVLFDGVDLSNWHTLDAGREAAWTVDGGILNNGMGRGVLLVSNKDFWNFRLHVDYRILSGSNSGIGLRGRYEVQILDDHGQPPDIHGNGAIYSLLRPSVNASKPAGEWQTFDIILIGRDVTIVLNGRKILDKAYIEGLSTIGFNSREEDPGPILLQGDHGPVEFRKIVATSLVRCQ